LHFPPVRTQIRENAVAPDPKSACRACIAILLSVLKKGSEVLPRKRTS
jgi:hypothetical protein